MQLEGSNRASLLLQYAARSMYFVLPIQSQLDMHQVSVNNGSRAHALPHRYCRW
jgi:hypothetical protein